MNKLISFDLSTNTGYAVFHGTELIDRGLIQIKVPDYFADVKTYTELPDAYPYNFMDTADKIADACVEVYNKYPGYTVVTEHTEGSSRRFSQRLLEFIHMSFYRKFRELGVKPLYLLNSDWRKQVDCYISQWPAFTKWNSKVGRLKKKAPLTKSGARVAKFEGKIVTRIDQKKLSIILANHMFGINLGNEDDIADAINMGRAALELGLVGDVVVFMPPEGSLPVEAVVQPKEGPQ